MDPENNENAHPYATVLTWVAEGKRIRILLNGRWQATNSNNVLNYIQQGLPIENFSLYPAVYVLPHQVVGLSYPPPIGPNDTIEEHDDVYIPDTASPQRHGSYQWEPTSWLLEMLNTGMLHRTPDAAMQHADTLLQVSLLTSVHAVGPAR